MKISDSVKTDIHRCLNCDKEFDMATCIGETGQVKPSPGDITMCLYCGHVMAFDEDLSPVELDDEQMHDIAGDKRILALQQARGHVFKERKH
jgi:hypothetical protein